MPDCSPLAQTITQMAINIASRPGVTELNDVLVKMQEHIPDMRRESLENFIDEATTRQAQQSDETAKLVNKVIQEGRTSARLRRLNKQLSHYLNTGTLPPKTTRTAATVSPIVQTLKDIRTELRAQLRKSPAAQKQRLQKSIAELDRKIKDGDIWPKPRDIPFKTPEIEQLEWQRDKRRITLRQMIEAAKPKGPFEKHAVPWLNLARELKTSFDVSGLLRQGGFYVVGHPIKGVKAAGKMFKALGSEQQYHKINTAIEAMPEARLFHRDGIQFTSLDGPLSQREEDLQSTLGQKIPVIGRFVRASERAYITILNVLRADMYLAMSKTVGRGGDVTKEEGKKIAAFVNSATGRGPLKGFEKSAVALNTFFFAPRYVSSRFDMILGQPLKLAFGRSSKGHTVAVKKAIAMEYGRYMIAMGLVYALAKLAGGELEDDPRSADFGKVKIGKSRLDPLSGFSQAITFTSRLASGSTKSSISGIVKPIRGGVQYGGTDALDLIANFARYKASPIFGTGLSLYMGKNPVGEEFGVKDVPRNLFMPLALDEVHESMTEMGVDKGTAAALLVLAGVGIQTYDDKNVYLDDPKRIKKWNYKPMFSFYKNLTPEQRAKAWPTIRKRWRGAQDDTRKKYRQEYNEAAKLQRR